jgi:threonine aldolase
MMGRQVLLRLRGDAVQAQVGDDVWGEDPTVARLQTTAAQVLGMEAAVFVPSGTMANLASVLAHCGRGTEVGALPLTHQAGNCAAFVCPFQSWLPAPVWRSA